MGPSISVSGVSIEWDPASRIFHYRAAMFPQVRDTEERLADWIRSCAPDGPYGILVEPPTTKARPPSGFSVAEMIRERSRIHVACYGLGDADAFMLPMISALTGVPLRTFRSRAEAEAWLRAQISLYTSPKARP